MFSPGSDQIKQHSAPGAARPARTSAVTVIGKRTRHTFAPLAVIPNPHPDGLSGRRRRNSKVGHFLRKISLNELLQFWNVLKGDMSLVGTRLPTPNEVVAYENWHRRRISIKSGITGKWQVSGRNKIIDFDDIVRLDLDYIDNWNIWPDVKILLKTILVVFDRDGSC
ncbi:MAG: sugar transferase [Deltaproteobacteria bacterium]|nr:sugar transferase [Candidatus Tharpella sp.]